MQVEYVDNVIQVTAHRQGSAASGGNVVPTDSIRAHGARVAVVTGLEPDEPVFVLRARDALALNVVAQYSMLTTEAGLFSADRREGLHATLSALVDWRNQHAERVRDPD